MALPDLSESELDELAGALRAANPATSGREFWTAVSLYRLLAEGEPVTEAQLAARSGVPAEEVSVLLREWPGVYRNDAAAIVGFWGLAQQEFPPHSLEVDGRQLWAWCSWDTLFLPVILGRTARVASVCATTGEPVRVLVRPDGVEEVSPAGAVISFLRPDGPFGPDVILSFCHHVLFFSSRKAGERWAAGRENTFLLSLEQGFELGRRVWAAKLGEALTAADAA